MALHINPQNFVEADEAAFGTVVLFHRRQFIVPYNQRPWAWKNHDLDNLWQDLVITLDRFYVGNGTNAKWSPRQVPSGDPHFFGAFVFLRSDPESLEVVDGQQRLTAVSMIVAILRDLCQELTDSTTDSNLKTNAAALRGAFDKWIFADPRPGEQRIRLLVDEAFRDLFDVLVASAPGAETRQKRLENLKLTWKDLPTHRALRDSFLHLNQIIREKFNDASDIDKYSLLVALLNVLEQAFICVWSLISEEAFAFQVFGCLNARGVPLSEADKIKSHLFTSASKDQHKVIETHWREIRDCVRGSDVGEFLRRRHIALLGACSKSALFQNIRDKEIRGAKPNMSNLTLDWKKDADLVSRILNGVGFRADTKELMNVVFNVLGVQLAWIPILSGAKKLLPANPDKFHEVVRLTVNYSFRQRTIRKEDTSVIENTLGEFARLIFAGADITSITDYLREKSANPAFTSAFEVASENRANVQFYILYEIEKYLSNGSGLAPLPHSPKQHIEHIMPQKFSKSPKRQAEWDWARQNAAFHRELINRIGNLCILESDINRDVSNFSFDAKRAANYPTVPANKVSTKKGYKDSVLKLALQLTDQSAYPEWSKDMIEKRQKTLATYALSVWTI